MRLVYMICRRTFTYVYMVFTYTYTYIVAFVFIMLQAHVSTQYPNKQTADKEWEHQWYSFATLHCMSLVQKNRAACFVKAFLTGQIREKNHFHMISDTGRDEQWSARTLQEFYNEVPNSELYESKFGVPSAVESRSQVSRIFSCVFGKARPGISHFKQSSFAGRNSFQMFCDEQNPIDNHSLIHPFIILSIYLSVQPLYMHKWLGSSTIQLALSTFVRYGPSEKSPDASSLYGLSGDTLHTYAGHGDFQDSALFPGTLDWSQTHS